MYFYRIRTAFLLAHWEKKNRFSDKSEFYKKYVFEALMLWGRVLGASALVTHPLGCGSLVLFPWQGGKWPVGPGNFP